MTLWECTLPIWYRLHRAHRPSFNWGSVWRATSPLFISFQAWPLCLTLPLPCLRKPLWEGNKNQDCSRGGSHLKEPSVQFVSSSQRPSDGKVLIMIQCKDGVGWWSNVRRQNRCSIPGFQRQEVRLWFQWARLHHTLVENMYYLEGTTTLLFL